MVPWVRIISHNLICAPWGSGGVQILGGLQIVVDNPTSIPNYILRYLFCILSFFLFFTLTKFSNNKVSCVAFKTVLLDMNASENYMINVCVHF